MAKRKPRKDQPIGEPPTPETQEDQEASRLKSDLARQEAYEQTGPDEEQRDRLVALALREASFLHGRQNEAVHEALQKAHRIGQGLEHIDQFTGHQLKALGMVMDRVGGSVRVAPEASGDDGTEFLLGYEAWKSTKEESQ